MKNLTMEEKIDAIYRTVVNGAPASDVLVRAAQEVVDARFDSTKQWDDLNNAICGLAGILQERKA